MLPIPPFFREPGNSLHWLLEDFPPLTWVLTWRLVAGQFPIDSIGFRIIDSTGPYIDATGPFFIIYLNLNHRHPQTDIFKGFFTVNHMVFSHLKTCIFHGFGGSWKLLNIQTTQVFGHKTPNARFSPSFEGEAKDHLNVNFLQTWNSGLTELSLPLEATSFLHVLFVS